MMCASRGLDFKKKTTRKDRHTGPAGPGPWPGRARSKEDPKLTNGMNAYTRLLTQEGKKQKERKKNAKKKNSSQPLLD